MAAGTRLVGGGGGGGNPWGTRLGTVIVNLAAVSTLEEQGSEAVSSDRRRRLAEGNPMHVP